jgi:hypothetical protein
MARKLDFSQHERKRRNYSLVVARRGLAIHELRPARTGLPQAGSWMPKRSFGMTMSFGVQGTRL